MSKMSQWAFQIEEDADCLALEQFVAKYGASMASVWHEVRESIDGERDHMEMDDGA